MYLQFLQSTDLSGNAYQMYCLVQAKHHYSTCGYYIKNIEKITISRKYCIVYENGVKIDITNIYCLMEGFLVRVLSA